MIRRNFITRLLALASVPSFLNGREHQDARISGLHFSPVSVPPAAEDDPQSFVVTNPPIEASIGHFQADPSALEIWRRLPMKPITSYEALPPRPDLLRLHGALILEFIESGTDFEFHYLGGSEPGAARRVRPVLLFRKFDSERETDPPLDRPVYLLAYCHTRQQARNFRLDRMDLL